MGQLVAEFDEVGPADPQLVFPGPASRRGEMWVVRHCGVAANAVEVLDTPLSRQAVIVPADGIEDVLASHSLEARDQIGMGIGERRGRHAASPTP